MTPISLRKLSVWLNFPDTTIYSRILNNRDKLCHTSESTVFTGRTEKKTLPVRLSRVLIAKHENV